MASQQNNPQQVVTGMVRLSFTHLFTPYANPNGGEPKYSTTILLPKRDAATKQRIDAAIQAAIASGVASRWNGIRPPQPAIPVHDGDGVRPSDGMPFGPECKGHWVFTASSKQPPQVVDAGCNPIIDQSQIYSGVYARVSIQFFPYANSGKKGIGCGLGNVQKLEDGEPLGGRTNAADDFGGGYAPAPMQQPYQQPAQVAYQQPVVAPQPYQQSYQPPYQQPASAQAYGQPLRQMPLPVPYDQEAQSYKQQPQIQPMAQPAPVQNNPVQYDPITGQPITGQVMGI